MLEALVLVAAIGGSAPDDLAELWCFESTLRGGSKLVQVPGEGPGHVLLRVDRGLAHAELDGEAALAVAAARWCAEAEGWSVELCADRVVFERAEREELEAALASLVAKLSGGASQEDADSRDSDAEDAKEDAGDSPPPAPSSQARVEVEPSAGWRRFREAAFPAHPVGRTVAAGGDASTEERVRFLGEQWGPEGAVLVVIGGDSGEVHRAASAALEPWTRARSPRRELALAADPRAARSIPAPAGSDETWVGFRLAWCAEGLLTAEVALAEVAGSWPRRMQGSYGTLLGARVHRAGAVERLEKLGRGEIDHEALRRAAHARVGELQSQPAALAWELARGLAEDGDPRTGLRELAGLAGSSDEELDRRAAAASALLQSSHTVTVRPGDRP